MKIYCDDEIKYLPTTIEAVSRYEEEQKATSLILEVDVIGSSLFSPRQAMQKAKEIRELTDNLKSLEIEEDQVTLIDVRIDSSKSVFTQSSKAHIRTVCARYPARQAARSPYRNHRTEAHVC